jgi:multidrug resistance efflux pump
MHIVSETWLEDTPDRIVVAPSYGTFQSAAPSTVTAEGEWVEAGQIIGEITGSGSVTQVRSPFRGCLVAFLVQDGDRVQPGKPLAHLEAV